MEDIKDFLQRHPRVTEIHFDADDKWCFNPGPNFTSVKVMTRAEILGKEDTAPKAKKKEDPKAKAESKKDKDARLKKAIEASKAGDELFEDDKFEEAKAKYNEAIALDPEDNYSKDRISECENLLAE